MFAVVCFAFMLDWTGESERREWKGKKRRGRIREGNYFVSLPEV